MVGYEVYYDSKQFTIKDSLVPMFVPEDDIPRYWYTHTLNLSYVQGIVSDLNKELACEKLMVRRCKSCGNLFTLNKREIA